MMEVGDYWMINAGSPKNRWKLHENGVFFFFSWKNHEQINDTNGWFLLGKIRNRSKWMMTGGSPMTLDIHSKIMKYHMDENDENV